MKNIYIKNLAKKIIKPIDKKFKLNLINTVGEKTVENLSILTKDCLNYISQNKIKTNKKLIWPTPFTLSKTWWAHDGLWINALRIRGVEIIPTMCDELQSDECMFYSGHWQDTNLKTKIASRKNTCENCTKNDVHFWKILNLNPVKLNSFITPEEKIHFNLLAKEGAEKKWKEIHSDTYPAGYEAWKAVVNNDLQSEVDSSWSVRAKKLFISHLKNIYYLQKAYSRVLEVFKPDVIFGNGGFYYFWGVLAHLSKIQKIPYYRYYPIGLQTMSWNYATDTHDILDLSPAWGSWIKQNFDEKRHARVMKDLVSRGLNLKLTHHEKKLIKDTVALTFNIPDNKPIYLLLTGVAWDATTNIKSQAFENMYDWAFKTIEWARKKPDIHLIVRVHPAENIVSEIAPDLRTKFVPEMKKRNISIPGNVTIIDFDKKFNTYDLLHSADVGLAYASTSGLEFACQGKPTVIAGECHYVHKGFTFTPKNLDEYLGYLNSCIQDNAEKINLEKAELARKYWYLYAFHASCRLDFFESGYYKNLLTIKRGVDGFEFELKNISAAEILPGKNQTIDYICDSIINNLPIFGENRWPPDNNRVGI